MNIKKNNIFLISIILVLLISIITYLQYNKEVKIKRTFEGLQVSNITKDSTQKISIEIEGVLRKGLLKSDTLRGSLILNGKENYELKIPYGKSKTFLFGSISNKQTNKSLAVYIIDDFEGILLFSKENKICAPAKTIEDCNRISKRINELVNKD